MPSEETKILELNQYQKSHKGPFIIYADFECIIEKIDWCINNSENLSSKQTYSIRISNVYNIFV